MPSPAWKKDAATVHLRLHVYAASVENKDFMTLVSPVNL